MIVSLLAACAPDTQVISSLEGDFFWTLEVDDAAEAEGFVDCSYSRHYSGEEDRSVPWLCPSCDEVWRATVAMPDDEQACLSQISDSPPEPVEWLGIGDGTWWRGAENWLLSAGTGLRDDGATFSVDYTGDWGPLTETGLGQYRLSITGAAVRGKAAGDPFHGFASPAVYTCGWPSRHAPAWEGPWSIAVGEIVPDGAFLDRCDEGVRLHDFAGNWLVIDISAMDCGPCQQMASEAETFLDGTNANVALITLLAPSLQDPFATTTRADIDAWGDTFSLESPVLRDRGWGFWMGYEAFGDNFGYPAILVVGPDGRIRDQWVGYSGWEDIQAVIDAG